MLKITYIVLIALSLSSCSTLNKGKINLNFSANPVEYSIK